MAGQVVDDDTHFLLVDLVVDEAETSRKGLVQDHPARRRRLPDSW